MKNITKIILSKSRILKPLKTLHKNKIIIFNYHRVRAPNQIVHFDEDLFGPDDFRFRQEMEWLKNETRILSEEELIDIVYSKKPIKEICSMVTFDDGYRDNFDVAFPILKELNIPAMFFIPTYHLSERKVGWWDIVNYLVKHSLKKDFTFHGNIYLLSNHKSLIKTFLQELKATDADKIDDYLFDLSNSLGQELPDYQIQDGELMTWDQIRFMSENGMTIGTHGHDHSIFSKQTGERLKAQLKTSIEILESVLDKKIRSIAYPVGGYAHFNEETKSVSRDLGLKLGFSYLTGVNQWGNVDPFDVKRMSIPPEWINLDIPLAFPDVFLKCQKH